LKNCLPTDNFVIAELLVTALGTRMTIVKVTLKNNKSPDGACYTMKTSRNLIVKRRNALTFFVQKLHKMKIYCVF
jgi:hypothetical protein